MDKLNINSTLASIANARISSERREELVQTGSILTLERSARKHNENRIQSGHAPIEYGFVTGSAANFAAKANEWCDDVLYFCAEKANSFAGLSTDRNDRSTYTSINLATNSIFMNLLSGIISDVMYSVTPALVSDLVGEMADVVTTPKGKTYEVKITSNDVFQWEDTAWTSLRSVPQHQLYNGSITVNPRPKATRFRVNFYQMIGNDGSMVDTLAAVAGGYAAMIMRKFTDAFVAAIANTKYVPSALKATSYTSSNWANVTQNVAMANRVRRDQLIGMGDFRALRLLLPDNATLAPAIMEMMGEEYFKNGYIAAHDGVGLFEIQPVADPKTINTTLTPVFPTDTIIIAARAAMRHAPMVMVFEEGSDMRLNLTPGDDTMATGWIEGLATASFDLAPVFASRIGVITGII